MAKKTTTAATTSKTTKARSVEPDAAAATPVKETKPRNTVVPPKTAKAGKPTATTTEVSNDMIAERAYHLWKAGHPGDELHHWTTAERELRGGK